jgi:hypothetical protein
VRDDLSIAAIIFGLIARSQIKQSGGRQGGDGLALAGLILGSVVAVLFLVGAVCRLLFILIMILIPASSDYSMLPCLWGIRFLILCDRVLEQNSRLYGGGSSFP